MPIAVSAAYVGALDLFRFTAHALDEEGLTGGLLAAELAAPPLLDLMARVDDWYAVGGGAAWPELASLERVEVYQATGMVIGQMDVGPTEALVRLRAHAYAYGMTVSEVALQTVERQLVLPVDRPGRTGVRNGHD